MFEFSVACKYLIPRRRQLSVSIISLISILVIATVVWLVVVFFSVTEGLEKSWISKLTALTAPVRITPKEAYFNSYYYLIDSISDASNYSLKTLGEKKRAPQTDPYNKMQDQEIPSSWPLPDTNKQGELKDLVKLAFAAENDLKNIQGLTLKDYELTASHVRLELKRISPAVNNHFLINKPSLSEISYPVFISPFDPDNIALQNNLLPPSNADLNHFLQVLPFKKRVLNDQKSPLQRFFSSVVIEQLKPSPSGWPIPSSLFPLEGSWKGCAIIKDKQPIQIIIPQQTSTLSSLEKQLQDIGLIVQTCAIVFHNHENTIYLKDEAPISGSNIPLLLEPQARFQAHLDEESLLKTQRLSDLRFSVQIPIQNTVLLGSIPYRNVEIAQAQLHPSNNQPFWTTTHDHTSTLPRDETLGEGVLLPKTFQAAGVLLGDKGTLSYLSQTVSSLQEMPIPIYVAGFYDPGIIPMGGKFLIANQEVTDLIHSAHQSEESDSLSNGINVRFTHLKDADTVKNLLVQKFKEEGIDRYWNVETYKDFEFTKPLLSELQSQKNLFMLIAVVIILVACSNIISMLIILVNDKKTEIGILRSMGATSWSIALIFGMTGGLIGILGSLIGIGAALLTLSHIDLLAHFLSSLQGYEMFSSNLYGSSLPSELSFDALSFVSLATVCLSLLAGIVPAIKACLLNPSHILRSGGE